MAKIPVGATIAQAYRFAFGNFLTNLGQIWVSLALLWALSLAVRPLSTEYVQAISAHDVAAIEHAMIWFLPLIPVEMVLICMQMVALGREALGLRRGSAWYYFSLGKPLWQLIGSMILVYVILLLAMLAGILATVLAFFIGKLIGFRFLGIIAGILFECAIIYGAARLTFVLMPIILAEGKIDPARAWHLCRGNFWRIFVVVVAILGPVMMVEMAFIFGFVMHGMPPTTGAVSPDQRAEAARQMSIWAATNQARVEHYWYILYPVGAVVSVVAYGLGIGAQCFAYRALVTSEGVGEASA